MVSGFNKGFCNVSETFVVIFFESANKSLMIYLIYLEVFLKLFVSKMKVMSGFLIYTYFSNFKALPDNFTNLKKG